MEINMVLSQDQADEVSCNQMCRVLWQGKIWIIFSICLFSLVGGYYSLSIKPLWIVSGTLSYSNNTKIIYGREEGNQGLVDYYKRSNGNEENKAIERIISNNVLFEKFFSLFQSFENKKEFILSSEIIKSYIQDEKIKIDNKFINLIASNLSISKNGNDIYILKFRTKNSKSSVDILNSYIRFIENEITKDSFSKLNFYFIKNKKLPSKNIIFANKNIINFESFINDISQSNTIVKRIKKIDYIPFKIEKISFDEKLEKPIKILMSKIIFRWSLFLIFGFMLGVCCVLIKDIFNQKNNYQ
jgi:hypothetical protein